MWNGSIASCSAQEWSESGCQHRTVNRPVSTRPHEKGASRARQAPRVEPMAPWSGRGPRGSHSLPASSPQSRPKSCTRQRLQFQLTVDTWPPRSALELLSRGGAFNAVRTSFEGRERRRACGPRRMARNSERIRWMTSNRVRCMATNSYPECERLFPVSVSDSHPVKMSGSEDESHSSPESFRARARLGRCGPRG